MESRIEEDQDEIEELLEKQRTHISQVSTVQSQLAEANFQVEELTETKASLESKVSWELGKEGRSEIIRISFALD